MARLVAFLIAASFLGGAIPALAQDSAPLVLQSSPEKQRSARTVRRPVTPPAPADDPSAPAVEAPDDGRAIIPNYLRRSGSRAGGPANDLNPVGQPDAEPLPGGDVGAAIAGRDLFHGNYCGYGNRGEGLPPIDALDAACMRHDACYDKAGYRSCACDRLLERDAVKIANSSRYSRPLRERASIVVQAGNLMQCRP